MKSPDSGNCQAMKFESAMSDTEYTSSQTNSTPEHLVSGVPTSLSPQEVASLVPMPALLAQLGFMVNERTRRSQCILCAAHNPTTFSWRPDGRWHCFRCNAGGDRIGLVRGVLQCGFREAMRVLCGLAGVADPKNVEFRGPTPEEKRRLDRLKRAAQEYQILENAEQLRQTDELRRVERLGMLAADRLLHLRSGPQERFCNEEDLAWDALTLSHRERVPLLAAYLIMSFSSEEDRQQFVLYPRRRTKLIDDCIWRGGVITDTGAFVELAL